MTTIGCQFLICTIIGATATAEDLLRRQISNNITGAGLALGLGIQFMLHGWKGVGAWLAGVTVGFLVFLVFFLTGWMGGGDVKLMAAFGACVGVSQILTAALFAAIAGAAIAILFLVVRKIRRQIHRASPPSNEPESIPYAPAISLGVFLSFLAG